jgi:hypothetical protein
MSDFYMCRNIQKQIKQCLGRHKANPAQLKSCQAGIHLQGPTYQRPGRHILAHASTPWASTRCSPRAPRWAWADSLHHGSLPPQRSMLGLGRNSQALSIPDPSLAGTPWVGLGLQVPVVKQAAGSQVGTSSAGRHIPGRHSSRTVLQLRPGDIDASSREGALLPPAR